MYTETLPIVPPLETLRHLYLLRIIFVKMNDLQESVGYFHLLTCFAPSLHDFSISFQPPLSRVCTSCLSKNGTSSWSRFDRHRLSVVSPLVSLCAKFALSARRLNPSDSFLVRFQRRECAPALSPVEIRIGPLSCFRQRSSRVA